MSQGSRLQAPSIPASALSQSGESQRLAPPPLTHRRFPQCNVGARSQGPGMGTQTPKMGVGWGEQVAGSTQTQGADSPPDPNYYFNSPHLELSNVASPGCQLPGWHPTGQGSHRESQKISAPAC